MLSFQEKHSAGWILGIEALALGAITLTLLGWNHLASLSAFMGGAVFWVANAYFTLYAFRYRGVHQAHHMVRAFYTGKAGKMVLTVVGFALVFLYVQPVNGLVAISSYALMTLINVLVASLVSAKVEHRTLSERDAHNTSGNRVDRR